MTAGRFMRVMRVFGILRPKRALPHRPAWFEATYLAPPIRIEPVDHQPRAWDDRERAAVWHKGRPIIGWDPEDWRVDHRNNPIFRHHYGDAESAFGWEVGKIAQHAGEGLANLRPQLCTAASRPAPAHFERALDLDRFAS